MGHRDVRVLRAGAVDDVEPVPDRRLERQRDEWLTALDARIGEIESDVRRRLEELSADAEAERAIVEARLQELLRRVDTAALQQS